MEKYFKNYVLILIIFVFGFCSGCSFLVNSESNDSSYIQNQPNNANNSITKDDGNSIENAKPEVENKSQTKIYVQRSERQKFKHQDERRLRNAIIKAMDETDSETIKSFKYEMREIDLNGDGRKEIFVWVGGFMGGTSGYPIIIFSRKQNGYRKLWSELAWTPIVLLNSSSKGWRDFAYQIGGGGAVWEYVIVRHNGKSYKNYKTQKEQPSGTILFDKDWKTTVFGPMPK